MLEFARKVSDGVLPKLYKLNLNLNQITDMGGRKAFSEAIIVQNEEFAAAVVIGALPLLKELTLSTSLDAKRWEAVANGQQTADEPRRAAIGVDGLWRRDDIPRHAPPPIV